MSESELVFVVGVDGSPGGRVAVDFVARLAAKASADVVVVHVFEPLAFLDRPGPLDFPAMHAEARARCEGEWVASLVDAGVAHRCRVVEGLPVEALVEVAAEVGADMIVIGSHGHSGWRDRIFGSVAVGLPTKSRLPVALVPLPAP